MKKIYSLLITFCLLGLINNSLNAQSYLGSIKLINVKQGEALSTNSINAYPLSNFYLNKQYTNDTVRYYLNFNDLNAVSKDVTGFDNLKNTLKLHGGKFESLSFTIDPCSLDFSNSGIDTLGQKASFDYKAFNLTVSFKGFQLLKIPFSKLNWEIDYGKSVDFVDDIISAKSSVGYPTILAFDTNLVYANALITDLKNNQVQLVFPKINTISLNATNSYSLDSAFLKIVNVCRPLNATFDIDTTNLTNYDLNSTNLNVNDSKTSTSKHEFLWSFGDNTYSTDSLNFHNYKIPGNYLVSLVVLDKNINCSSKITKTITIPRAVSCPEVTFNAEYDNVFGKEEVELKGLTYNMGFSQLYLNYGDGLDQNISFNGYNTSLIFNHAYSKNGNYNICLTNTHMSYIPNCPVKTYCQTISANNSNDCKAEFTPYIIDKSVSFIPEIQTTTTKYFWDFGDNSLIDSISLTPIHSYKKGTYNVCLKTNELITQCFDQKCQKILIGDTLACNADFNFTENIIPTANAGLQLYNVRFINNSYGATNYNWDFGNGLTSRYPNNVISLSKGSYKVRLSVFDTVSKCMDQVTKMVQVDTLIMKADFDAIMLKVNKYKFVNKSIGEDLTIASWDFGDGSTLSAKDTNHIFKMGTYNVCLTVSNANYSQVDKLCKKIIIKTDTNICTAAFDYYIDTATNGILKLKGYFKNTSISNSANSFYRWEFGDGTASINQSGLLSNTYKKPGYYNVTLYTAVLSNDQSTITCYDSHTEKILVGNNSVDLDVDFEWFTDTNKITHFVNKTNDLGSQKYLWNFDDEQFGSLLNPKHAFTSNRLYNVCLTVKDTISGAKHTTCKNVFISGTDAVDAEFSNHERILLKEVHFFDQSIGNVKYYEWNFGDPNSTIKNISSITNPVHVYTNPGYYLVQLKVYNSAVTRSSIKAKLISVGQTNTQLACRFTNNQGDSLKTGKGKGIKVDFVGASYGDPASFQWDFGDGSPLDITSSTPSHTFASTGIYYVCYKVMDTLTDQTDKYCQYVTVTQVGVNEITENINLMNTYPNPANDKVNVDYYINNASAVELAVFDMMGNQIAILANDNLSDGQHQAIWNAEGISSGLYYIRLTADKNITTKKVVILK